MLEVAEDGTQGLLNPRLVQGRAGEKRFGEGIHGSQAARLLPQDAGGANQHDATHAAALEKFPQQRFEAPVPMPPQTTENDRRRRHPNPRNECGTMPAVSQNAAQASPTAPCGSSPQQRMTSPAINSASIQVFGPIVAMIHRLNTVALV